MKIGVTEQSVVKRLNRVLLTKGRYLRKADSRKQKRWGFGRYYLLDSKGVVDKGVNIEQLGRQLGVVFPRKMLERQPRYVAFYSVDFPNSSGSFTVLAALHQALTDVHAPPERVVSKSAAKRKPASKSKQKSSNAKAPAFDTPTPLSVA